MSGDPARAALQRIYDLVQVQAEDEGLWFTGAERTAAEAYVQQGLRRLSALIEHEWEGVKRDD